MPECRECGEPIQFLPHPKTGKVTPYDDPLPPPPNHYQSKAHRDAVKASQNGQKPAKVAKSAKPTEAETTVIETLMGQAHGMKKKAEAERLVAAAGPAEDADALYLAVLAQLNAEMVAKERR